MTKLGPDGMKIKYLLLTVFAFIAALMVCYTYFFDHPDPASDFALYTSCRNNLKNIYMALQEYKVDNGSNYPASDKAFEALVPKYLPDIRYLRCPVRERYAESALQGDYVFDLKHHFDSPGENIMVTDAPDNHKYAKDKRVRGTILNLYDAGIVKAE